MKNTTQMMKTTTCVSRWRTL